MRVGLALLLLVSLGSCDRLLAFGQGNSDRGREAASIDLPARPADGPTAGDGQRPTDRAGAEARAVDGRVDGRADAVPVTGQWAKVWIGSAAAGNAVSMTSSWIYVVGHYEGWLKVDSHPPLPAVGTDAFVARVSRSGLAAAPARISTAAGDSAQSVVAVAAAGSDQVWVGGRLDGNYALGAASYTGLFLFEVNAASLAPVEAAPLSGGGCATCGVLALAPSKGGIALAGTWLGTLQMGASWTTVANVAGVVKGRWQPAPKIWEGAPIAPASGVWSGRAVAGDADPSFYVGFQAGIESHLWAENPPAAATFKMQFSPIKLGGLALDGQHLYVVGTLQGTYTGGTGSLTSQGSDIVILKIDTGTGTEVWSAKIGGAGEEEALAVAASGGRLYIAGRFGPGADLGNGPVSPRGLRDGFVLRFDPQQAGQTVWSVPFGGLGGLDEARGVVADAQQVVVAGVVSGDGEVTFAGAPQAFNAPLAGGVVLFSRQP